MSSVKKPAPTGGTVSRLMQRSAGAPQRGGQTVFIDLDKIRFDPNQPRKAFHAVDGRVEEKDQIELKGLADSIDEHGLIHPITVSELPDGFYLVRVGERRTRAYMLLGHKKIEAKIRNDLDGIPGFALQLAENTDRQDLTDLEIADSIMFCLTKSKENPNPLSKAEVARVSRKSAGWVTRYINFADKMQQQKWVLPGYVASPEVLYQLSTLSAETKEQIYGDLSSGKLSAPLRLHNIKQYKDLQSVYQSRSNAAVKNDNGTPPTGPKAPPLESDERTAMIAAAMQGDGGGNTSSPKTAGENQNSGAGQSQAPSTFVSGGESDGGYQLPDDVAQSLRAATYTAPAGVNGSATVHNPNRVLKNAAVPCRISVSGLVELLTNHAEELKDMGGLDAEIRLPTALAVRLVKQLTNEVVDEDSVSIALAKAVDKMR